MNIIRFMEDHIQMVKYFQTLCDTSIYKYIFKLYLTSLQNKKKNFFSFSGHSCISSSPFGIKHLFKKIKIVYVYLDK